MCCSGRRQRCYNRSIAPSHTTGRNKCHFRAEMKKDLANSVLIQASTLVGSGNINTADNHINRSKLLNCDISSSRIEHSLLENSTLKHVQCADRIVGHGSTLISVRSVKRSSFENSEVRDGTTVKRSTVEESSITDESRVKRCLVTGTSVVRSTLKRSTLDGCQVMDSVVDRSTFSGMILKYGIWKRGKLVGRTGEREPVAIPVPVGHDGQQHRDRVEDTSLESHVETRHIVEPMSRMQLSPKPHPPAEFLDTSDTGSDESAHPEEQPPPYHA